MDVRRRVLWRTSRRPVVWLALALSLGGIAGEPRAQVRAAERPTYVLGDRWVLSDAVYEVTRVEKDAYVFTVGTSRIVLSRDLVPVRIERGGTVWLDLDPPPRLTWPLEVGKARRSSGEVEGAIPPVRRRP